MKKQQKKLILLKGPGLRSPGEEPTAEAPMDDETRGKIQAIALAKIVEGVSTMVDKDVFGGCLASHHRGETVARCRCIVCAVIQPALMEYRGTLSE